MLGQLGIIVVGFADNIMVGHHSTAELAAASFVNNFFNLVFIAGMGFSYGLTPIIGGYFAQKEYAKAQASNYANANNMVVLIDEDKIERMAEDENYRKQYEGIIANAASGLSQLGQSIAATGANVKGYGMQVNDGGTASFFAVLKKSGAAQKERIAKKAEQKKEAKKAEAKKAQKEAQKERLEKSKDKTGNVSDDDDDTVTITASSMEELLQKIQEYTQKYMNDDVKTDDEKKVGQQFDYSV